jgi:hypothetical protein
MSSSQGLDLRRLDFDRTGLLIEEQSMEKLEVATEEWILFFAAIDEQGAKNSESSLRFMASRDSGSRLDIFESAGGGEITRLLGGVEGLDRAVGVQFLISFGDAWADGAAGHRLAEPLDFRPIDELLRSMSLLDEPRSEFEVPPVWLAYQRDRQAGSPIAKFSLFMQPAPVMIGEDVLMQGFTLFTDDDYQSGGRQLSPKSFEFYAKGDPLSVRVDLWLEEPPAVEDRETCFEATLQLRSGSITVGSFDTFLSSPILHGNYEVTVTRVHLDCLSDRRLTDS